MNTLDLATIALLIVGGLNWGLVGVADWNLVAALFGAGSVLSRLVYVVVGVSAIWQIGRLVAGRHGWGEHSTPPDPKASIKKLRGAAGLHGVIDPVGNQVHRRST